MTETIDHTRVDEIIDEIGCTPTKVIAILQSLQESYRYLPRELFPHLARRLDISEAGIYSVATFYENFSLEPMGRYIIKVCDGTACHVRKSAPILEALRGALGLSEDKGDDGRPQLFRPDGGVPRRVRAGPGHDGQR